MFVTYIIHWSGSGHSREFPITKYGILGEHGFNFKPSESVWIVPGTLDITNS